MSRKEGVVVGGEGGGGGGSKAGYCRPLEESLESVCIPGECVEGSWESGKERSREAESLRRRNVVLLRQSIIPVARLITSSRARRFPLAPSGSFADRALGLPLFFLVFVYHYGCTGIFIYT